MSVNYCKDRAFMGVTHATSVLGVALMVVAFLPDVLSKVIGATSIAIIILFVLTSIGGGNIPDLDNTASRAKSDLGIFGGVLSAAFRVSATIIQTVIRTKRDDIEVNPHRGFWHTIPAALLLGAGVWSTTLIPNKVELPFFGEVTIGWFFALFFTTLLVHLAFSTLLKSVMDSIKKSAAIGEFIAFSIALVTSLALFSQLPDNVNFLWLGVSVAFGMTIHILGDLLTTAGVPILFPLSGFIKGKFWWNTRILPIKAGGAFEKYVFMPVFIIMIVVASVKIFMSMM